MDKEILKTIADNPALREALRKVLEKQFALINLSLNDSDTVLGQSVRANLVGMSGIESAFKEIDKYKTIPDEPERVNPAR